MITPPTADLTPNTRKVAIALEEMGLAWRPCLVDMLRGDQLTAEFRRLNPNGKSPVIEDEDAPGGGPLVLWESGAILWYLAEKTGRFLPQSGRERAICHQWLMFQVGGVGPMFGQSAHFSFYAERRHPYAVERYENEARRLLQVLDRRLGESPFLAGPSFTIADMATYPFTLRRLQAPDAQLPNLARWSHEVGKRPRGRARYGGGPGDLRRDIEVASSGLTAEQRSILSESRHTPPQAAALETVRSSALARVRSAPGDLSILS